MSLHQKSSPTVFKPIEQVRYHVEGRQRPNNPTYNSVFMTSSLNNFVASPYSKGLLKDTEYKKSFDKLDGSMAGYESMLKSQGRKNENIFQATNGGINFNVNRSSLSKSGHSSFSSSLGSSQ